MSSSLSAIEYLEKRLKGGRRHPSTSSFLFACSSPHLRLSSSALFEPSRTRSPHLSLERRGKGVGGSKGGRKRSRPHPSAEGSSSQLGGEG
ncbi:hypothetical protein BDN70DRAFT_889164 [Pholiota conissans]|uniref:Uncharacterized protein n=1 Tax=Pholiota conissans TaxID=109636 RepID=A0A9P5YKI5_9AGAR|nr:hypothetical protein BDN70DRAFT_889164 [Pholiota conissans]